MVEFARSVDRAGSCEAKQIMRILRDALKDSPPARSCRRRLQGVSELLEWYATNPSAIVRCKINQPQSYYDKLKLVATSPFLMEDDAVLVASVLGYVDNHVSPDRKHLRSAVVTALSSDRHSPDIVKNHIRSTVASAWTAAVADGLSAPWGSAVPLRSGAPIPLLLDPAVEAVIPRREAAEDFLQRHRQASRSFGPPFDPSLFSWQEVAGIAKNTQRTRDVLQSVADKGHRAEPDAMERHEWHLRQEIAAKFPGYEAATTALPIGIAVVFGSPVTALPAAAPLTQFVRKSWRWMRTRMIVNTLRRGNQ